MEVMARPTLAAINRELAARGIAARLARGGGYFYFMGPAVAEWWDRTVPAERIGERSVEDWVRSFRELQRRNRQLLARPQRRKRGAT